jgi:hypothetical protein
VVFTLYVAVATPLSARVTRLNVPNAAPVLVVAENVTWSRGLIAPTDRRSVTRIPLVPPELSVTVSGATNTASGNDEVNCAVVSALVPSTVAVILAVPTTTLVTLARAVLLPSASTEAGVICPNVVRNATVRRPAGRFAATVAVHDDRRDAIRSC